jgi:hypothetical protein
MNHLTTEAPDLGSGHPGTVPANLLLDAMNIAFDARLSSIHRATENTALRRALVGLLDRYVGLVESGDAGFWDAEKEQCVINARDALALNVGGISLTGGAEHDAGDAGIVP